MYTRSAESQRLAIGHRVAIAAQAYKVAEVMGPAGSYWDDVMRLNLDPSGTTVLACIAVPAIHASADLIPIGRIPGAPSGEPANSPPDGPAE